VATIPQCTDMSWMICRRAIPQGTVAYPDVVVSNTTIRRIVRLIGYESRKGFDMESTIYRVYVGLTDRDGAEIARDTAVGHVLKAMSEVGLAGATIFDAVGVWEGKSEASLVVEFISFGHANARSVAVRLKSVLNQNAVLVVTIGLGAVQTLLVD